MKQVIKKEESKSKLVTAIVKGMQDKKAQNISVFNLSKIKGAVADYFILCSGRASTQIEAIAEGIIKSSYQEIREHPWRKEGFTNKEWIFLDYVDVIVHIFHYEKRERYALDLLWADADITYL